MSSFEFCFIYLNVSFGGRGVSGARSQQARGWGGREAGARQGVSGRRPPGAAPGASEGGARSAGLRAQRDRGSIIPGPNQLILINCQQ